MSKKLHPRIIHPLPAPKRNWPRVLLHTALILVLVFDGAMFVATYQGQKRLQAEQARLHTAQMLILSAHPQTPGSAEPPAVEIEAPNQTPDLYATPVPTTSDTSEPLPEADTPKPPRHKHHRASKAEPSADELNARWLVRFPHGTTRLEPIL